MSKPSQCSELAGSAVVTLLSDFGLRDGYVAQMKLAILEQCPSVTLVDVTHQVPPQDVLAGAIALQQVIACGATVEDHITTGRRGRDRSAELLNRDKTSRPTRIHLAVVDPGVGTSRKMLIAKIAGQWIICPDNGLITWAWHRHTPRVAHELIWRPKRSSRTFHGRDIMGPVAGMIAAGVDLQPLMGKRIKPMLLPVRPAKVGSMRGKVIHIDHFGNAITNLTAESIEAMRPVNISIGGAHRTTRGLGKSARRSWIIESRSPESLGKICANMAKAWIGPLQLTYAEAPPGQVVALVGSSGLLEIAVVNGSAARDLDLSVGDCVDLVT